MFKLCLLVLLSLAVLVSAGQPQDLYDPTTQEFQERHTWFIGTVANDRDQGKVWVQDTQVVAPVDFSTGQLDPTGLYTSIQRYTWYQDNYYNQDDGAFCSVQVWPRVMPDETIAFAMQEICAYIEDPYFKFDPPVFTEGPATYDVQWVTPAVVESLFVQGSDRLEVAVSKNAGCISWQDATTGKELLNECLTNSVPGEFREYSLNVMVEALPGDASTTFLIWNTFNSQAQVPPTVVSDAFAKYYAGEVPLAQDPHAPAGLDVQIHLYVPPAAKRDTRDEIHNDGAMVYNMEDLQRAFENRH